MRDELDDMLELLRDLDARVANLEQVIARTPQADEYIETAQRCRVWPRAPREVKA